MAIAFDAKTKPTGTGAGSTSQTFSHTCTGSDRFLIVTCTTLNWTASNPTSVAATYNGVAMTSLAQNLQIFTGANNWRYHAFYLIAPASGANDVVVTATGGSGVLRNLATSYNGVDQTSPVLTSNTASSPDTGNTMTISLTTAQAGWWFIAGSNVDTAWTAGGNITTLRDSTGDNGCGDSNGSVSVQTGNAQLSHTGTRGYAGIAIAFKESTGAPTASNQYFTMMGVG